MKFMEAFQCNYSTKHFIAIWLQRDVTSSTICEGQLGTREFNERLRKKAPVLASLVFRLNLNFLPSDLK